jgi:DNA repair exonuclease SbcCD ATPase subunit
LQQIQDERQPDRRILVAPTRNARNWVNASASGASSLSSATSCNSTSPHNKKAALQLEKQQQESALGGQPNKLSRSTPKTRQKFLPIAPCKRRRLSKTSASPGAHPGRIAPALAEANKPALNRWQQLETLAQRQRELAAQQTTLASQLQQGQMKITAQEAALSNLRNQHKELNAQVADKQKLLDQERRIQSLEAHRQQLQAGAACPLCGSN